MTKMMQEAMFLELLMMIVVAGLRMNDTWLLALVPFPETHLLLAIWQ